MIKTVFLSKEQVKKAPPALVVFNFQDKVSLDGAGLPKERSKALEDLAKSTGFAGKAGERVTVFPEVEGCAVRVRLYGLGEKKKATLSALRSAAATAVRCLGKTQTTVRFAVPSLPKASPAAVAQTLVEGVRLGMYRYDRYKAKSVKKEELPKLEIVEFAGAPKAAADKGQEVGTALSDAVALARDWVNTAPSDKNPAAMAKAWEKLAKDEGLHIKVHDKKAIEKMGMNALLGVARGSDQDPPYLVHLTYKPKKKAKKSLALVGKGITFDSGGLSLKPAVHMVDMKMDMGGSAAVMGAMLAIARLKPKAEVHGIAAFCYNMPGDDAQKPGDVVTAASGKTIEILNTDAEGRLILADALHYAGEQKPDQIIDLATLTGAQIVALGNGITGLMTNNAAFAKKFTALTKKTGEDVWELPLPDKYRDHIKSKVADIKNIGNPMEAGTIAAGLFLKEFVDDKTPWIHLDIAGPAWTASGCATCPAGGTGVMVKSLVEHALSL